MLEYFFWFTSRVFYQVRHGFVPLGGNTVFIRRDLMLQAGGWPDNLTEDCALGVLLCTRYDAKVVAAYEPELVTREEVPETIGDRAKGSLFWQRVRWNQGFLSVLLEGRWARLPTVRQRVLAGYILATPFLQAFSALLLPLAVLTILSLKVPVAVAMLMYAPFVPILITLAMQLVGLRRVRQGVRQRVTLRHYAFLLLGAPVYQLGAHGAPRSGRSWQHVQGNTTWHKTDHGGHHRRPRPSSPRASRRRDGAERVRPRATGRCRARPDGSRRRPRPRPPRRAAPAYARATPAQPGAAGPRCWPSWPP